jgi:CheY-like chemotaxis protein
MSDCPCLRSSLSLRPEYLHRADIVGNGQEVLEALHRQPYDLVLMDVHMPKMDGFSATEQILQQWSAAQRPKIIAMTANAMAGDRDRPPSH